MARKILSTMFFIILAVNLSFSQNPEWINFTYGNNVNALAIEGDYIWVGTTGGLVKVNMLTGEKINYNRANSGLPYNWVNAIAMDSQGNKWIGTNVGGLAKFDGVNWTVYNTSNSGLPSDNVNAIAIDSQGNKWIATNDGLAKFDGVNWTVYKITNSGLENKVRAIAIDSQRDKWIVIDYGLGFSRSLAKFDGVNWTVYSTSNSGLPSDNVNAIAIDLQGNKWIGTYGGGLAKFDGVNWTVYNKSNSGLPSNVVNAIALDSHGNKWIATGTTSVGGGLTKFDGVSWTVYNRSNSGLPSDVVNAIAIDSQGNKWIGPFGGGLAKFDGVNWTIYNRSNSSLLSDFVYSITIDLHGNKWIGAYQGLAVFREGGVILDVDEKEVNTIPKIFTLNQNYPNPFNPETKISYTLPKESNVSLKVYDVLGNEVATLVNEVKQAGVYNVTFNAKNLTSGLYIYKLQTENYIQTKKMMLIK